MNKDNVLREMEKNSIENFKNYEKLIETTTGGNKEKITEEKNKYVREIVGRQLNGHGYFDLVFPYKNVCHACNGYGQIFKFKKPVAVFCHTCNGIGIKFKTCKSCENGLFIKMVDGMVVYAKPCKDCGGKGQIEIKCLVCDGTGIRKKLVSSKKINDYTICNRCEGKGFIDKTPSNPVLEFKPKWLC